MIDEKVEENVIEMQCFEEAPKTEKYRCVLEVAKD